MQYVRVVGSKEFTADPLERAQYLEQQGWGRSRDYTYVGRRGKWAIRPTDWLGERKAKTYEVQERELDGYGDVGPVLNFDTQVEANWWVITEHGRRVQENLPTILEEMAAEANKRRAHFQKSADEADAVFQRINQVLDGLTAIK